MEKKTIFQEEKSKQKVWYIEKDRQTINQFFSVK